MSIQVVVVQVRYSTQLHPYITEAERSNSQSTSNGYSGRQLGEGYEKSVVLCTGGHLAPVALCVQRMKECVLMCIEALCQCMSGLYVDLLGQSLCNVQLTLCSVHVCEVCRGEQEGRCLHVSYTSLQALENLIFGQVWNKHCV